MKYTRHNKLNIYTAAAGAFAAAGVADAQVVYTDVNPDTVINNFQTYLLDIDNNGQPEMNMEVIRYPGGDQMIRLGVQPVNGILGSLYQANYPLPFALDNGDSVSATTPGWQSGSINGGVQYLAVLYGSQTFGNWTGVNDKYLGVRFRIGQNTHYGWARLSVAATGDTLTIKDYAYQAIPDLGITAGDMVAGVPANSLRDSLHIFSSSNTVIIRNSSSNPAGTVRILNTLGQCVCQTPVSGANMRISLEDHPHGIYFVEVSDDKNRITKKVYIF